MKKNLSLVLVLAFVLIFSFSCKKSEQTVANENTKYSKAYSIACIYSQTEGEFWGVAYNGCMKALEELSICGIQGYCVAPVNCDYILQTQLIDSAIQKGVQGIILSPANPDSVGTYITDTFTDSNGIPIVVIDRALNSSSKWIVSGVMSDSWAIGQECGKLAIEAAGGKGRYLLYGLSTQNTNWAGRSKGAMDFIQNNSSMKNIYSGGDGIWWGIQSTMTENSQFLKNICNFHMNDPIVIITACETYTDNAVAIVNKLGARKESAPIFIIGVDLSWYTYSFITSGQVYGSVVQNPYLMGYTSAYALLDYLETGKINSSISIPYCVVTNANIETQEIKDSLASMKLNI